ncbi:hypothetical protein RR46_14836 [Papilio xuthus]|uniref:Secreted protein n=1 Tax=Papilio xuthus TaxID=66420 RepID=A0A194PDK3_PAPXU|nr:hypothetical protein RR46_14836 [Papilio xuthus]
MLANDTGTRLLSLTGVSASLLFSLSALEFLQSVESSTVTMESVGPLESTVLSCSASPITSMGGVLFASGRFLVFIDRSISPHRPKTSLVLVT